MQSKVKELVKKYGEINGHVREQYRLWLQENKNKLSGGESAYALIDNNGKIYRLVSMAAPDNPERRSHRPLIHPITGKPCPVPAKGWRFTDKKMDELLELDKIEFGTDETVQPRQKYLLEDNMQESVASLIYYGGSGSDGTMKIPFDNPKPMYIAKKIIDTLYEGKDSLILDFFSGSATTAHAVMQLNAEDGGRRKYIMVQLPELTSENSEAYKAGYKNICEIGKERIRRAGRKIKEEAGLMAQDLDFGFRCLRLDSSNMKDVYYKPEDLGQMELDELIDNVKDDRSAEDLLFQVMLELSLELSLPIETVDIAGHKVFKVDDGYLIACFEPNITEEVVTAIAKETPVYAVLRDSSLLNDSLATNFEQIFKAYSPATKTKVL